MSLVVIVSLIDGGLPSDAIFTEPSFINSFLTLVTFKTGSADVRIVSSKSKKRTFNNGRSSALCSRLSSLCMLCDCSK